MKRWPAKLLGNFVEEQTGRLREATTTIYSVTNERGFVRSLDLFDKQVFSTNTGNYKRVGFHDLAYNPSRINVGSIGLCEDKNGGAVSPMYVIVRCNPGLLPRYLLHFLKSDMGLNQIRQRCEGAVRFQLKFRDFCAIPIVAPPLAEQERIVKLLDDANELRHLRTQADHCIPTLISALFREMFGDPDTNPKKLPIVPLGTLLSFKTGKLDSNAAVKGGAYPFFTCSREDFEIDTYAFDCEALLLAGNNATADYSVKYYNGKFNAYQRTYVLTLLNHEHSYGFMQWALQLRLRELKRRSLGTNTKYLTLGILKNINIPLPPPLLQKEFAKRVTEIRALEAEQVTGRHRLDALYQSLLHNAFNGEL